MRQQPDKILSIVGRSSGFEGYLKVDKTDVWCVSSVFEKMVPERVDLIFQLHKPEIWEKWLNNFSNKVITAFSDLYRIYPVEEMLNKYGPIFGSTVSWMLALAIKEGYNKIYLFGLDMASKEEYINQRDTLFYMIGRAEALGIEIIIPESSRIFFKDRIYGVM